jgi:hypothetical protein
MNYLPRLEETKNIPGILVSLVLIYQKRLLNRFMSEQRYPEQSMLSLQGNSDPAWASLIST